MADAPPFTSWLDAAEFGTTRVLTWMRKLPEHQRLPADEVRALVQTALWQSEQRGAALNRGYVVLRAKGAVIDELRHLHGAANDDGRPKRSAWAERSVDIDECEPTREFLLEPAQEARLEAIERAGLGREVLRRLPLRDRYVLRMRFVAGMRQEDVARAFGVTGPRICQLEARALERARGLHERIARRRERRAELQRRLCEMRALYEEQRWTLRRVAERFAVAPATLRRALQRAGVRIRPYRPDRPKGLCRLPVSAETVARLYREHQSMSVVAQQLGCSMGVVRSRLQEAGVAVNRQGQIPPERITARKARAIDPSRLLAIEWLRQGTPVRDVAQRLGRHRGTVEKWSKAAFSAEERAAARRERLRLAWQRGAFAERRQRAA